MSQWKENENGNFVCQTADGVMTVYRKSPSGEWSGICEGWRLKGCFTTPEEAMDMMVRMNDGDYSIAEKINSGWQKSKSGGHYRKTKAGVRSVKQASSGKWYISLSGHSGMKREWFDSAQEAMRHADRLDHD